MTFLCQHVFATSIQLIAARLSRKERNRVAGSMIVLRTSWCGGCFRSRIADLDDRAHPRMNAALEFV